MQYSDTSNLTGIIEDITFLLGNVDTNQYTLKDRTRNVNERYRTVWSWIFEVYGGWKFIDDNVGSTAPYADQTITSGTKTYGIPTGALTISAIEVKDSTGIWRSLTPTTIEEIQDITPLGEFMKTNNIPSHYILYEDNIDLYPTPNYTQASSIRVYYDQGISTFASTDTTKTPGFASPFHRALSVGASLDFALAHTLNDKTTILSQMWLDYEKRIKDFYSKRYLAIFPQKIKVADQARIYN